MDALVASLGLEMEADKKKIEPVASMYSVTPPPFLTDRTPLLSNRPVLTLTHLFLTAPDLATTIHLSLLAILRNVDL
jgi:hypothetical protein